jgi:hypothetical protein
VAVTREAKRRAAAAAAAALLLAVTGCSGDTDEPPAAASTPEPTPSSSAAATPSSSPTASPSSTPGVPTPGSTERPATTAGPLTKASFPSPQALGPGWRYAVDPGDAEEGYAGNGTSSLARSPEEVVQTAVPFGCDRDAAMPTPAHALEVDYTLRGAKAIAVRGQFASPAQAGTFFSARERNLRACLGRSGSAAIGPLVADLTVPGQGAVSSDRTPASDPWREVAVLDGDTVVLLAVQGADRLSDPQTRRLVRLFRS